jgi:hypothetical protein
MRQADAIPIGSRIARWVARIWALLLAAFALLRAITPDPLITEPVPLEDVILLGFWGVAILGLVIGWRWEVLGAGITIGTMVLREVVWVILKGDWIVNFLIVWALVVPPALLYLLANRLGRRSHSQA